MNTTDAPSFLNNEGMAIRMTNEIKKMNKNLRIDTAKSLGESIFHSIGFGVIAGLLVSDIMATIADTDSDKRGIHLVLDAVATGTFISSALKILKADRKKTLDQMMIRDHLRVLQPIPMDCYIIHQKYHPESEPAPVKGTDTSDTAENSVDDSPAADTPSSSEDTSEDVSRE